MRLMNIQNDSRVKEMAIEICLRAMSKIIFLDFKPSTIAGSALLLALNLKRDHFKQLEHTTLEDWSVGMEQ
jgi:hypothetical protein